MTLQEILDAVFKRYPHSYQNQDIISMINDIQKRLFRTIYKPQTSTTYDIIADNPFYPISYSPENIIEVVVNGEEYPYQNIKYDSLGCYYYITDDNSIGIYPTPKEDVTSGLTVFRYGEPTPLTTSDLGIEPDFDRAFHMLIVYAVCKELAEMAVDSNMINAFISQYNGLEQSFKRSNTAKPQKILDVYGVRI